MRLKRLEEIYSECPVYYLTIVTHGRTRNVANREMHSALISFAERAPRYGVVVGTYVIMPDHIHLLAAFAPDSIPLSKWVKSLKNSLSKCLRSLGQPAPHWQKDFFDRVLRSTESYEEKSEYIRNNPVASGLVLESDQWPFQGAIFDLDLDNDRRRS